MDRRGGSISSAARYWSFFTKAPWSARQGSPSWAIQIFEIAFIWNALYVIASCGQKITSCGWTGLHVSLSLGYPLPQDVLRSLPGVVDIPFHPHCSLEDEQGDSLSSLTGASVTELRGQQAYTVGHQVGSSFLRRFFYWPREPEHPNFETFELALLCFLREGILFWLSPFGMRAIWGCYPRCG